MVISSFELYLLPFFPQFLCHSSPTGQSSLCFGALLSVPPETLPCSLEVSLSGLLLGIFSPFSLSWSATSSFLHSGTLSCQTPVTVLNQSIDIYHNLTSSYLYICFLMLSVFLQNVRTLYMESDLLLLSPYFMSKVQHIISTQYIC